MSDQHKTTGVAPPYISPDEPDDEPIEGDWIECWECGGEGGVEGDDPFWDWGDWNRCGTCRGKGGWVCGPVDGSDAR